MTGQIINRYKRQIDELVLVPSDGGRFEISLNGDLIYSKLETGEFPDEDQIVAQIGERL